MESVGFEARPWPLEERVSRKIAVHGMMCQKSCGTTVENGLLQLAGVHSAVASFEEGSAVVECEHGVTVEELIDAVEGVGFEAMEWDDASLRVKTIKLKVDGMMCQKNCGSTVGEASDRFRESESRGFLRGRVCRG